MVSTIKRRYGPTTIIPSSLPWAVIIILVVTMLYNFSLKPTVDSSLAIWSPANGVVEYELRLFDGSTPSSRSKYQGEPNEERNRLWLELYEYVGISQISKADADKLVDKTSPIPGNEENYFIQLDVFHQLHCLNTIRMAFWPQHFNLTFYLGENEGERLEHIGT
ncbi:uncharacterized protein Z518_09447 [Rhinocladiella mackenziei CBS 650.93]|uniref:Uncharacterized protein n=1 Tax=Rhinocladiella mackenziei CBS 650.93 TaxID=1442369 RepID=A0A0D2IEN6_9EURO|nr:uncharacterized protein Z518_09447 [Rhinocladiella mackenziei CBS 650.93]KIX01721.1 hypothetical protein Z518_09447 [Rhinocladiella mackenziei CBS 650.93]